MTLTKTPSKSDQYVYHSQFVIKHNKRYRLFNRYRLIKNPSLYHSEPDRYIDISDQMFKVLNSNPHLLYGQNKLIPFLEAQQLAARLKADTEQQGIDPEEDNTPNILKSIDEFIQQEQRGQSANL